MKHCVIRRAQPTNSKLTVMRSIDESFEENYGAPRELALPTRLLEPGPCIRGAYIARRGDAS